MEYDYIMMWCGKHNWEKLPSDKHNIYWAVQTGFTFMFYNFHDLCNFPVTKMNNSQKIELSMNEISVSEQVNRGDNFHTMCTTVT